MSQKIFFHGNFESDFEWEFLGSDWTIFPLWDFVRSHAHLDWNGLMLALKDELSAQNFEEAAGYSLGGRVLLGLVDAGYRVKSLSFFSTHPGLSSEEERNERIWSDLKWKEKVLTSDWEELHAAWNALPIFSNDFKPYDSFERLEPYRSEIAHSFDVLGLGHMPDYNAIKFPKDAHVQWVCGQHDHKFRVIAETFCKKHSKINYLVAFNRGHRIASFAKEVL